MNQTSQHDEEFQTGEQRKLTEEIGDEAIVSSSIYQNFEHSPTSSAQFGRISTELDKISGSS